MQLKSTAMEADHDAARARSRRDLFTGMFRASPWLWPLSAPTLGAPHLTQGLYDPAKARGLIEGHLEWNGTGGI